MPKRTRVIATPISPADGCRQERIYGDQHSAARSGRPCKARPPLRSSLSIQRARAGTQAIPVRVVAGDCAGHSFRCVFAAAWAEDPGNGERRESPDCLNRAGTSRINEAASHTAGHGELSEPTAAPYPVREHWVGPPRHQRRGTANGSQSPSIRACAERYHRSECHTEHSKQHHERNGGPIKADPAKQEFLVGNPAPSFAAHDDVVRRAAEGIPAMRSRTRNKREPQRKSHRLQTTSRATRCATGLGPCSSARGPPRQMGSAGSRRCRVKQRNRTERAPKSFPFPSRQLTCGRSQ